MGCLKYTYSEKNSTLKVVHSLFPSTEKSCAGAYRYGFNGKERDMEGVGGGGSTYDYGFRIYNPGIARFLSVDPLSKSFPWNSPYSFAEGNPIRFIDLDGLEKANPEMFELALHQICQLQTEIINDPSKNKTVVKGVKMMDVLEILEQTIITTMTTGVVNVKTNKAGVGYYCGKSAAHNDLIQYNPMGYVALMTDLFTKGEGKLPGGIMLSVRESLKLNGANDPKVNAVEEIFGKVLDDAVSKKSTLHKLINRLGREMEGNTIPHEYKKMLKAVGMKVENSSYEFLPRRTSGKFGIDDICKLEAAIQDNCIPIVFEDHVLSEGNEHDEFVLYGIHFVGITSLEVVGDIVKYTVWEYGKEYKHKMSVDKFSESMKGYWIPKDKTQIKNDKKFK